MALVKAYLGEVDASAGFQDRMLESFAVRSFTAHSAYDLSALALAAVQVGDLQRLRHAVAALERDTLPGQDADQPPLLASQACLALAEGRADNALSLLRQAVDHPVMNVHQGTCAAWLLMLLRLELGPRSSSDGQSCLQRLRPLAGDPSPQLEAWSQRARAAACRRRGDSAGALAALMDALSVAPGGLVQALCRLDAAWLWCERGDVNRANVLWAAAGHWASEHPIGLAVKARMLAQQGAATEAVHWQSQALGAWRGARPSVQEGLLQSYRLTLPGVVPSLPALQGFASDAWWA